MCKIELKFSTLRLLCDHRFLVCKGLTLKFTSHSQESISESPQRYEKLYSIDETR